MKMQVSSLTLFLITIMAGAAILAQSTEAHDNNNNNNNQIDPRNHPDTVVVIKGPGVLPGPRTTKTWLDEDFTSCWTGLVRTYGCIPQIYEAVYLQSFDHFDKQCCLNIIDIIDSCWPRMFPKHPQFSRSLKKYCSFVLVQDNGKILPKGPAL